MSKIIFEKDNLSVVRFERPKNHNDCIGYQIIVKGNQNHEFVDIGEQEAETIANAILQSAVKYHGRK